MHPCPQNYGEAPRSRDRVRTVSIERFVLGAAHASPVVFRPFARQLVMLSLPKSSLLREARSVLTIHNPSNVAGVKCVLFRRAAGRARTRCLSVASSSSAGEAEGHQYSDQTLELGRRARHRPSSAVFFSLLYLGPCRHFGLIRSSRRSVTRTSSSWCSVTRSASWNVSCTGAFATGRQIGRSSRRSAGCSREHVGGRSSSRPRPCSVGTAKRPTPSGALSLPTPQIENLHHRRTLAWS
jgi:hypothetical protein